MANGLSELLRTAGHYIRRSARQLELPEPVCRHRRIWVAGDLEIVADRWPGHRSTHVRVYGPSREPPLLLDGWCDRSNWGGIAAWVANGLAQLAVGLPDQPDRLRLLFLPPDLGSAAVYGPTGGRVPILENTETGRRWFLDWRSWGKTWHVGRSGYYMPQAVEVTVAPFLQFSEPGALVPVRKAVRLLIGLLCDIYAVAAWARRAVSGL